MFDVAWSEMAVVALVAIIVLGPKELPRVLRTVGQGVRKLQDMARDFQRSLDDMAREAEIEELEREVKGRIEAPVSDLEREIAGDLGDLGDTRPPGGGAPAAPATDATPPAPVAEPAPGPASGEGEAGGGGAGGEPPAPDPRTAPPDQPLDRGGARSG
ncbi:MAG: twin-arginine translocase subunit TatB [Proteobacteria bacterium]|nr:twin-arginine translocase subunit TatB [Pseudomonadota bacterium]